MYLGNSQCISNLVFPGLKSLPKQDAFVINLSGESSDVTKN